MTAFASSSPAGVPSGTPAGGRDPVHISTCIAELLDELHAREGQEGTT